jgi:hypothetical protein
MITLYPNPRAVPDSDTSNMLDHVRKRKLEPRGFVSKHPQKRAKRLHLDKLGWRQLGELMIQVPIEKLLPVLLDPFVSDGAEVDHPSCWSRFGRQTLKQQLPPRQSLAAMANQDAPTQDKTRRQLCSLLPRFCKFHLESAWRLKFLSMLHRHGIGAHLAKINYTHSEQAEVANRVHDLLTYFVGQPLPFLLGHNDHGILEAVAPSLVVRPVFWHSSPSHERSATNEKRSCQSCHCVGPRVRLRQDKAPSLGSETLSWSFSHMESSKEHTDDAEATGYIALDCVQRVDVFGHLYFPRNIVVSAKLLIDPAVARRILRLPFGGAQRLVLHYVGACGGPCCTDGFLAPRDAHKPTAEKFARRSTSRVF